MSLDDDTLRRLLAARTPGEWEMRPRMWEDEEYYVEVRGAPPGYLGCRYHNVGGTWEPVADAQLWAAAPALAAEVLRLRAEIERRDADDAESECREIERHQRMCAALDIPEEDRAYATDEEVEAAAIDAVCERDALACAEVLRLRESAPAPEPRRDLAARGMRECAVCDGTGSLDLDDVDCGACGGRGGAAVTTTPEPVGCPPLRVAPQRPPARRARAHPVHRPRSLRARMGPSRGRPRPGRAVVRDRHRRPRRPPARATGRRRRVGCGLGVDGGAYESAQGAVWGRLADAATPLARSLGDDAETAREADDLAALGAVAWGRL